jgi:hypothetical protein
MQFFPGGSLIHSREDAAAAIPRLPLKKAIDNLK